MLNKLIFENAWEYFARVGGIKIRGLGILPDKKNKKYVFLIFYFFDYIEKLPINRSSGRYVII